MWFLTLFRKKRRRSDAHILRRKEAKKQRCKKSKAWVPITKAEWKVVDYFNQSWVTVTGNACCVDGLGGLLFRFVKRAYSEDMQAQIQMHASITTIEKLCYGFD